MEARDLVALTTAMERLLKDRAEAARLGERARSDSSARQSFAIETTTSRLKHLLVERAGIVAPGLPGRPDPTLPRPGLDGTFSALFR